MFVVGAGSETEARRKDVNFGTSRLGVVHK
jgi:hypothetical protein